MTRTPVIGFEVHAQLATRSKIFCSCANIVGGEPNTRVCPVCLGLPGALPVLNDRAVELGIVAALAVDATVADRSSFARKSYFYPDLPKGYQITQDTRPLATGGGLDVESNGRAVRVGFSQLHIEEDAGKMLHRPGRSSLVDMNRCGVPLLEIVTLPELTSIDDAVVFAEEIRRILVSCGVTSGRMHEGGIRFDTNVSLAGEGGAPGTPCEIKNLNSFRSIRRALEHEIDRQRAVLDGGGRIAHQTLLWDEREGEAHPMRSKEEASDYRYFREPDLPDIIASSERIEELRALVPELPGAARARLRDEHGLAAEVAGIIADDRREVAYFEEAVKAVGSFGFDDPVERGPACARWLVGPLRGLAHARGLAMEDLLGPRLPAARLAELIALRARGRLTETAAKELLGHAVDSRAPLTDLIEQFGLRQLSDEDELSTVVASVLDAHPEELARLRRGEDKLIRFLTGQVMKKTGGRANPRIVGELIRAAAKREDS